MRHHRARKKQESYAANSEESWPLGVSHTEQHTKFGYEFAQLDGCSGYESRRFSTAAAFLLKIYTRVYRPAGISVVATGFRFAFCSMAFALVRSLF